MVRPEEVEHAISSIHFMKAPRIDAMNSYFFKVARPIIKHDVINVLLKIFENSMMYRPANVTSITPFPKKLMLAKLDNLDPFLIVAFSIR